MSRDEWNPNGYGSLGGVGADSVEEIKTQIAQDGSGVEFICPCGNCQRETAVTAEWPELVIMMCKRPPQGWQIEPKVGAFMPLVACRCGARVPLGITPDECERHLRGGIANGKISQQAIQAIRQQYGI